MAFWLWAGAAAVIVLLAAAVALSSIRIRIRYSRSGKMDQLVIVVRAFYGVLQTRRTIPTITLRSWGLLYEEKGKTNMAGATGGGQDKRFIGKRTIRRFREAFRNLKISVKHFREWLFQTLGQVECTRWRLDVRLGTGDAAHTAVLAGLCWTLMGCVNAAASQFIRLRTSPHGRVESVFSGKEFALVWEADFRIRVSKLAYSIMKLGVKTMRIGPALRAWRAWKAGPEHA
ncbi:DUF2953 domain-containing protein [Cohnella sp. AR92]|uniref:DUF2953 domain-containing protein n=1 Tax=Cohnella sp. AR92 TaxID=648716 RepID=UPI000F8F7D95|nr:DUF2953 domain-containing protein [Cohnella sp. AR92]RUS48128.1 DUF2953 domain-containing protein [Cohnella sp. AR92]